MDEFNKVPNQNGAYYYPPTQYTQNQQQAYQQGNYYMPPNNQPSFVNGKPPKKPKKKKNPVVIILLIVLVIIGAIAVLGGAYSIVNESDTSKKVEDKISSFGKDEEDATTNDDNAGAKVESSGEAAQSDKNGNYTVAGVAKNCMDSCVLISVYTDQSAYNYFYGYGFSQDNDMNGGSSLSGEGSGVIMSESNGKTYIMTAAHVISSGDTFKVTTNDGKEYDATRVGYDSQTDIGVLAIKAKGLKIAKFGDSKDIQVGEQCVVIGCPGGSKFMNSVATGIVSALDRPVSSSIGYNNECIQTDAAINPGNSGGALFNMQGQVIGINSSKIASTEYEGMGFAVPSSTAVKTANSLIKNGYVSGRAILGIKYNAISNFSSAKNILAALEKKGFKDAEGTMVIQEIDEKSDLNNKNIEQYDMIVAVDGKTMTSTDVMTSTLSKKSPGDTVKLTIARIENNSIKTFDVTVKLIEETESK